VKTIRLFTASENKQISDHVDDICVRACGSKKGSWKVIQTDTDRQTQTDRHRQTDKDRQTDRQTDGTAIGPGLRPIDPNKAAGR
jgi:hypothetical protein